mgnify:FL=1
MYTAGKPFCRGWPEQGYSYGIMKWGILSAHPQQGYSLLSKIVYRILLPVLAMLAAPVLASESGDLSPFADLASYCPAEHAGFSATPVGREQVQEYYRQLDGQLQWQAVARREQLRALLENLRHDGLQPSRYLQGLLQAERDHHPGICLDAAISHGYLLALHDLENGALAQAGVEPYWVDPGARLKPATGAVELALRGRDDLAQAFIDARPSQALYGQLREQLRNGALLNQTDWGTLPSGKSLRAGNRDARVPALRERLERGGYLPAAARVEEGAASDDLYGEELEEAVRAFQRDHYLEDDGIIGPATLRELNVTRQQRLTQIRVNLERLRWLEKYYEPRMLIAGARLMYLEDSMVVWRTRTQVGTQNRQTPLLKSRITHLTMNPTWTVPPTIFRKDKLPAIRNDLGYLRRSRMQVLDAGGRVLDPATVDWSAPGNIMLRQAAGPDNALGRVAIRIANPIALYLHDTPSQTLIGRATRNVSSGCVRVEGVQRLLDLLARDDDTRKRIGQLLDSGQTRQVNLAEPTPVLLAYWTVEVDADGLLRFRADSYGHDRQVAAALEQL